MQRYPDWPNLAAMMFRLARAWGRRPMLRVHRKGAWHAITWGEFGLMAASAARRLREAGINAGDRVVIVSENRPEYPIIETALMALRAIPVPAYITNTRTDHAHILADSGARAAIVSTPALAATLAAAGPMDLMVVMDGAAPEGVPSRSWDWLVNDGGGMDDIAAEADLIPSGALACLIYTSGTGGAPRGVMTPHRAILSNCRGAWPLLQDLGFDSEGEVYLSYLPLSHSYEHTAGQFFMLSVGAEVVYARGMEQLGADMAAIRPTILTMVPRVLEVIRGRIMAGLPKQPAWRQALFHRTLALGLKRLDGQRLNVFERLQDTLLERLVREKVRARFGGRLKAAISGGARLEPDIGRFYLALGLKLIQGYGQTEAGPVISANWPSRIRIETVGPPLAGVELRLAEDGEILVRGDLVMDGYWGRPAETAVAIQDGWLHTGDIGVIEPDGYLRITDRKKDMIVLSGGDNVSPARVEGMLVAESAIAQAVVFGDGRAGITALIVPTEGYDDVAAADAVTRVNMRLSVIERVRKHACVAAFTIDNGQMTATQKVRRHMVRQTHAELLARLGA